MSEDLDCTRLPDVWALHDGELDPRSASEFRAHAAGCPACGPELRALERFSSMLASGDPAGTLSTPARRRMREELLAVCREESGRAEERESGRRSLRLPFFYSPIPPLLRAGVALGALAVCLALWMLQGQGPVTPAQGPQVVVQPPPPAQDVGVKRSPLRRQPSLVAPERRVVQTPPPRLSGSHARDARLPSVRRHLVSVALPREHRAARGMGPKRGGSERPAASGRALRPVQVAAQPERLVIQSEGPVREEPAPRPRSVSIYARGDGASPAEPVAVIHVHREEVGP